MSDVLISYAREDRPAAEVLAKEIEAAGYSVWWDRELLSGEDFERAIQDQLASAGAVVVIWSLASIRSGWVKDEASTAMERGVLVPVLLGDGATPPLGFRSLHSIPFKAHDLAELKRALVRRVATPARAPTIAPRHSAWGIGMVEGICLLLLAAAVGWFLLFIPR